MIKKIFIGFLLFVIIWSTNANSIQISPKIEEIYIKLVSKIENKYELDKQNTVLLSLGVKLLVFKNSSKYKNNQATQSVLEQFLYLNDKKILEIRKNIIINNIDIYENKFKEEIRKNKAIIDKYSYSSYFKNISYTNNHIFLENWVWYTYNFKQYNFFPDDSTVNKNDLEHNGINLDLDLLFITDKWGLWFVKNPIKIKLISDYIIRDLKNKYYFLEEIKDDKRNIESIDYDNNFKILKELSEWLTSSSNSKEEKISIIYNYILTNTEYTKIIDLSDAKIFSWIEAFNNNSWVCEWYVKLMVYMLLFAWIDDSKVIRWYVIDAQDFPQIWHAWVKIDWSYYDPTFDDPIWAISDRISSEYKYFNLPKDLFYTNRYDEDKLPESIKNMNTNKIEELILTNLYNLYDKYKDKNYELLKLIKFKTDNWIDYKNKIDLTNLSNILPQYIVNNFSFKKNWLTKRISKLNFYELNNENIDELLEQLNYNLSWYYYFKWTDDSWIISYKLAYNVEFK